MESRLHRIYDKVAPAMRPHIGRAFRRPQPDDLRVLLIGINPYDADHHAGPAADPGRWAKWWLESDDRFFRGSREAVTALGAALQRESALFRGRVFHGSKGFDSCYATNLVKRFPGHTEGKSASRLTADDFECGKRLWYEEIDVLASEGVLPHVVVVFGRAVWPHIWPSLGPDPKLPLRDLRCEMVEWLPVESSQKHEVAAYRVRGASGLQDLLLVRLAHPSRGQAPGSVRRLLAGPDFRRLAGLPK